MLQQATAFRLGFLLNKEKKLGAWKLQVFFWVKILKIRLLSTPSFLCNEDEHLGLSSPRFFFAPCVLAS